MGMGFKNYKVGFGKKMNWEMGLVLPLQDPPKRHASFDFDRSLITH